MPRLVFSCFEGSSTAMLTMLAILSLRVLWKSGGLRRAAVWGGVAILAAGGAVRVGAEQPVDLHDAIADEQIEQSEVQAPSQEEPASEEPAVEEEPLGDQQPADAAATESTAAEPLAPPAEQVEGELQDSSARLFRPITQVSTDIQLPEGLLPEDVIDYPEEATTGFPKFGDTRLDGMWAANGFTWAASKMKHRPLYFEEVNLERYGYGCHPLLQPAVSSAHFFLTIPAMPYKMVVHPPRECIYTLGYYRPGDCVPWRRNLPPWSAPAGAVEAATVVGLVFLIP